MFRRSIIYLERTGLAVKRPVYRFLEPRRHAHWLAACKTLASRHIFTSPWKRPRRVTARLRQNSGVENEIRFLTSLVGKGPTLREPLGRVRPVGVVPPAVRVPAEAVALRLD